MKSLLLVLLVAVLSVRNDAAEIRDLSLPKNTSLADPNFNIPATLDLLIDEYELLDMFDGDQTSLSQDGAVTRANLNVGSISSKDKQLYRSYFSRPGIANAVRTLTITYRGASSIRISAVRAREQGTSQNARAAITAGGIGRNTVTIRLTSASCRGFHYLVEIWGR